MVQNVCVVSSMVRAKGARNFFLFSVSQAFQETPRQDTLKFEKWMQMFIGVAKPAARGEGGGGQVVCLKPNSGRLPFSSHPTLPPPPRG